MKKLAVVVIVVLLVVVGGFGWFKQAYGGTERYVKITENGQKSIIHSDSGESFDQFTYHVTTYDKAGNAKQITFTADHNLKIGAYLDLTDNTKKGVTNWKEVNKADLPTKVAEKLNETN